MPSHVFRQHERLPRFPFVTVFCPEAVWISSPVVSSDRRAVDRVLEVDPFGPLHRTPDEDILIEPPIVEEPELGRIWRRDLRIVFLEDVVTPGSIGDRIVGADN